MKQIVFESLLFATKAQIGQIYFITKLTCWFFGECKAFDRSETNQFYGKIFSFDYVTLLQKNNKNEKHFAISINKMDFRGSQP